MVIITNEKFSELKHIGKRIQKLREAAGFSQESFARKCGFSRSFYTCIERGEENLTAITLIKISKNLGVHVGDLFPLIRY